MEDFSGFLFGFKESRNDLKTLIPESEHRRILEKCIDVPEEKPTFPLSIDNVGISRKIVWIKLPHGKIPFEVDVRVNLPSSARGIHMSRIERSIAELYNKNFVDVADYAKNLVVLVKREQMVSKSVVKLFGKIPMVQKAPVTRLKSIDSIQICTTAECMSGNEDECKVFIGAGLTHITACPCTQAYNVILSGERNGMPLPTHTQRSITWLTIERDNNRPTYEELILCLKTSLHSTYDLLKRPDEAELVLLVHNEPQFAEDAARATAREVGLRFGNFLPRYIPVKIESHSLESIHNHDVRCDINTTMDKIMKVINSCN